MYISFYVAGEPKPAGSKRAVIKNGKIVIFDTAKNRQWKKDVGTVAKIAMKKFGINKPIEQPVCMKLRFDLKKSAKHNKPVVKPDLTKLVRCVEDAMTGIVYKDDALIIEQHCFKQYADKPGVHITIKTLE